MVIFPYLVRGSRNVLCSACVGSNMQFFAL